jgi:hypothetical protein
MMVLLGKRIAFLLVAVSTVPGGVAATAPADVLKWSFANPLAKTGRTA